MNIKLNEEVKKKDNGKHSWLLAYSDDSDFYIPNALHVERNDRKMLVNDDNQACIEAKKAGIPLISGIGFIPNDVYVDTEENRKILSEMLKLYPDYKKIGLLDEIFEYYNCQYKIYGHGKVKEYHEDGSFTFYGSIDETLKKWVNTMEETNKNLLQTGDVEEKYNTWCEEKIEFIKNIL